VQQALGVLGRGEPKAQGSDGFRRGHEQRSNCHTALSTLDRILASRLCTTAALYVQQLSIACIVGGFVVIWGGVCGAAAFPVVLSSQVEEHDEEMVVQGVFCYRFHIVYMQMLGSVFRVCCVLNFTLHLILCHTYLPLSLHCQHCDHIIVTRVGSVG
jgi:hypothetical protein